VGKTFSFAVYIGGELLTPDSIVSTGDTLFCIIGKSQNYSLVSCPIRCSHLKLSTSCALCPTTESTEPLDPVKHISPVSLFALPGQEIRSIEEAEYYEPSA
jgi:hypothetical protein